MAVEKTEVQNCILDVCCRHKVPVLESNISWRQSVQNAYDYLQVEVDLASLWSLECNHENTDPYYIERYKQLQNSWKQGIERVIDDIGSLCRIHIFFGNLKLISTSGRQEEVSDYFAPSCGLTAELEQIV